MKLPSLDNAEGLVLLVVVGVVAYTGYKAYKTGSNIAGGIKDTFTGIVDSGKSVVSDANVGLQKTRVSMFGPSKPDLGDQSNAETERLLRQNGGTERPSIPAYTDDAMYDPMGTYIGPLALGTDTSIYAEPQNYSPSALGIA